MKKTFAIVYFIVCTASYSANASQYPYQPARSTQILAVIKKSAPKSANKSIGKNNVIVNKKAVNSSSQTQQIEKSETVTKDVKKEKKIFSNSEKLVTETNSTDNKVTSKQRVQEVAPAQEQGVTEMNLANGADLNEKLEEEKKYQTNSMSEMKTQGHYVGFDIVGIRGRYNEDSSRLKSGKQIDTSESAVTDTGGGVGLNYKYAFNFNNVFIAPGVFAEWLAMEINSSDKHHGFRAQEAEANIKSRHGALVNIGYDVNDYLSPYLMAGYSWVNYKTKNFYYTSIATQSALESSMARSGIYGAGLKFNYDQDVSFNIEFNTQKFNAKTSTDVPVNVDRDRNYVAQYLIRLNTLKLGIAYKF